MRGRSKMIERLHDIVLEYHSGNTLTSNNIPGIIINSLMVELLARSRKIPFWLMSCNLSIIFDLPLIYKTVNYII
jgi:hypothetical protein